MQKQVGGLMALTIVALAAPGAVRAGPASPQPARIEARLVTATAKPRTLIVDGRIWRCEADLCTSGGGGRSQPIARECKRAARQLGPVAFYRNGAVSLDAAALAACNGG